MKKPEIFNTLTRSFHKAGFEVKKHSPEILIVAGVVGTVAGAVMACKATLKVNKVVEETKKNIEKIHEAVETGVTAAGEEYTEVDAKNDLRAVYAQTAVKIVKEYAPAVLIGAMSLTAVVSSNHILRKRNIALTAAYTTLNKGFKDYRGRVVERFGKELDRELRYGIKAQEVEEVVTNEDGSETVVVTTVNAVDPTTISDYAVVYDDGNIGWSKDPEMNKMFLKSQERYANEKLKTQGHLFLNEVYDMLGFPRTEAGNIVGWIYDEKHPNGDNFVDFGLFDIHDENKRRFVNGLERCVIIDPNVDGPILNLI